MAMEKFTSMEVKVGLMAGFVLLLLAVTIFTVKEFHFGDAGYPIDISFQFVDALKPQADVVIGGGVKIGRVTDIVARGERIHLNVIINRQIKIPRNAKFQIMSKGLMGDKYLNVAAQADTGQYLLPGSHVQGVEPTTIDKAFERFGQVANSIKMLLGDPNFKINLGEMLKNFGRVAYRLDRILAKNEKNVNHALEDFAGAAQNVRAFSQDIETVTKGLEQVLSQGNQENLEVTLAKLKVITERFERQLDKIEKGEGTIGMLANDKQVAQDLKDLVKDIKNNPWKLLWKQ